MNLYDLTHWDPWAPPEAPPAGLEPPQPMRLTFSAPSDEVAAVTALLIGRGMYGAQRTAVKHFTVLPRFGLGGDREKFFRHWFHRGVDAAVAACGPLVPSVVDSIAVGDRDSLEQLLAPVPSEEKHAARVKENLVREKGLETKVYTEALGVKVAIAGAAGLLQERAA